jgi:hypothetical protein
MLKGGALMDSLSRVFCGMDSIAPDEVTRRVLARYEAGDLVTACAWCRRVGLDGEWLLVPRVALAVIDHPNSLTHGVCPSCAARLARPSAA